MFEACPTCGYVDKGKALRQALADAKKEFPPTLDFYDFGDGIITMPLPDPATGSYRTRSVSYLIEADPANPVPEKRLGRVLGFTYHLPFGSRGDEIYKGVITAAMKAFEHFAEKAEPLPAEGGMFPKPIEV